jgi:hypothetical protein
MADEPTDQHVEDEAMLRQHEDAVIELDFALQGLFRDGPALRAAVDDAERSDASAEQRLKELAAAVTRIADGLEAGARRELERQKFEEEAREFEEEAREGPPV